MKKLVSVILVTAMVSLLLVGCSGKSSTTDTGDKSDSKSVTVYSSHPADPLLNTTIKKFQDKTGITVDLVAAGTGELLKRVEAESNNPQCDVFWGGGADSLAAYSKYFASFTPTESDSIDKNYLSKDGTWSGESPNPMVIMYNKELVSEADAPKCWADLINEKFKGKIAYADPAKSGSSYTILCIMLTAFGKDDGKGWDFMKKFVTNLNGKILSSSGDVYKKVADKEYSVGLTQEKEAIKYINAGARVGMVYPSEGTAAVPDGIAIVKDCDNKKNAETFVNYILSNECQSMMSKDLSRRAVRLDTDPPKGLSPLKDIKMVNYDFNWASSQKTANIEKWKEIIVN